MTRCRTAIGMTCLAATALAFWGCGEYMTRSTVPSSGDPKLGPTSESFTILLRSPYVGASHVRDSSEGKRQVEAATQWGGLFVIHEERSSSLYLGRYGGDKQAGAELEKVRRWQMSDGSRPFAMAIVTKLVGERVGPPQWDLANAIDPNWCYTLVIAEFHNVPEEGFTNRKEVAVANCRGLRDRGLEAFYYHGPAKSVVTLGTFPVTAYKTEVMPNGLGQGVISSETLRTLMHDYHDLWINGYKAKAKGSNDVEGTYVTAISDYCPGNTPPLPRTWFDPRDPNIRR